MSLPDFYPKLVARICSRLLPEQVLAIRAAAAGGESARSIARRNGINHKTALRIIKGEYYREVAPLAEASTERAS